MTDRHGMPALRTTIAAAALLAASAAGWAVTGSANERDLDRTVGTVQAINAPSREVKLITGCGHALRVTSFHAVTDCRIEVAGKGAPLTDLKRGQIVVVRHRRGAECDVAESIATLPPADDRRRP